MTKDKKLKKRNLEIIQSARRHLENPMKYKDLCYVPLYERAVINCALDDLEKRLNYDLSLSETNKEIYHHILKCEGKLKENKKLLEECRKFVKDKIKEDGYETL